MAANPEIKAEARPSGSKLDLIHAAVSAISRYGLSELTSARIAGAAGHTAASINFHFGGKEALLLATLSEVSEEYAELMANTLAAAGDDALLGLLGIIDVSLSPRLSDSHKIAVWYAFLAESGARANYQRICGERDQAYIRNLTTLCTRLIDAHGAARWPNATAVALGLAGLMDQLWQGILFEGERFDREAARRRCRDYLCSVFPWLAARIEASAPLRADAQVPVAAAGPAAAAEPAAGSEPGLHYTLPAWIYHNEEFHELEKQQLFMPSWQLVCHVSELARSGDYVSFEFFGQRGFALRDEAGTLRAFHNVCAHRAHGLVEGERGQCGKFLTCKYHGWTYHLDGRNRSISAADSFAPFDRSQFGLKPIELEVWLGFVFVRFRPGAASVAERMAPHRSELAHYRIEQMVPLAEMWVHDVGIDWKNVVENYVEDYHFPMGHPGLTALMDANYERQVLPGGTMRLSHTLRAQPRRSWSAERYAALLPEVEHLPADLRRRWTYFGLFPNVYFDVYPEWMDFFQLLPTAAGRTRLRARVYGFPDERREMRAARYLNRRLNYRVQAEDEALTHSVQQGLESGAYTRGILSDKEIVLAGFQDWVRERLPVAGLLQAPARGTVAARNAELSG
jgi:phenylpropionate dioxygenase-like ring-hydroxylating dioxygenase large terminal subunit/AcrR family transcriptional regulator